MSSEPPKKPSNAEDEYFAREDAEKLRKLAHDHSRALQAEKREELRKLHHGHCSNCGMDLHTVRFRGMAIQRCFDCGATVFLKGELEKLGVSEGHPGVVSAVIDIFK